MIFTLVKFYYFYIGVFLVIGVSENFHDEFVRAFVLAVGEISFKRKFFSVFDAVDFEFDRMNVTRSASLLTDFFGLGKYGFSAGIYQNVSYRSVYVGIEVV